MAKKKKKEQDLFFWERPKRYKPTKCKCCDQCWFDTWSNKCVYGGPYDGYYELKNGKYLKKEFDDN